MVKVTISVSDDIIDKLNNEAALFNKTRSGFVTDLIKQRFNGASASTTGENRDIVVNALQDQVNDHTKTIKDLQQKLAELKGDKIFLQKQWNLLRYGCRRPRLSEVFEINCDGGDASGGEAVEGISSDEAEAVRDAGY